MQKNFTSLLWNIKLKWFFSFKLQTFRVCMIYQSIMVLLKTFLKSLCGNSSWDCMMILIWKLYFESHQIFKACFCCFFFNLCITEIKGTHILFNTILGFWRLSMLACLYWCEMWHNGQKPKERCRLQAGDNLKQKSKLNFVIVYNMFSKRFWGVIPSERLHS